jgi:hypothetical protein
MQVIRLLLAGLWVCVVTAGTSYGVAYWKQGGSALPSKDEFVEGGLQYHKTRVLSVPMVDAGSVQGYIVARFVYTVEAKTMSQLSVPPDPFVVDEAFRMIYADDHLDFKALARYDLSILTSSIKKRVNERMQLDVIQDILVDEFNYVSKEEFQKKS